jgi:cytochrome c oxidase subunit 2
MTNRRALVCIAAFVLCVPAGFAAQEAGAPAPHVVQITARKYRFEPATITVRKGERVRFEVTALDTTHGIEIKEFGVKRELKKGQMEVIEFTPDHSGTFPIKCSKFCGLGHGKMKGTLVVED